MSISHRYSTVYQTQSVKAIKRSEQGITMFICIFYVFALTSVTGSGGNT